jgi:hypothetical protein
MRLRLIAVLVALALGAWGRGEPCWAGPMFNFSSTVSTAAAPTVPSNPPGSTLSVQNLAGGELDFTNGFGTGLDSSQAGGASAKVGSLTFGAVSSGASGSFDYNFNYLITLTDEPGGTTGMFSLTGELSGTSTGTSFNPPFTPGSISSTLSHLALSQTSLTLGSTTYFLALGNSTAPNGGGTATGSLDVIVSNAPIPSVPEPATLAFALLACGVGGVVLIRRRRRGR